MDDEKGIMGFTYAWTYLLTTTIPLFLAAIIDFITFPFRLIYLTVMPDSTLGL